MATAAIDIEGHVDRWDGARLFGWACVAGPRPAAPLAIELVGADGAVIARAVAEGFRGDLAAAGKRGGFCAFAVPLAPVAAAGPFRVVARAGDDGSAELPGGPFAFESDAPPASDAPPGVALADARGARGYIDHADARGVAGWVHEAATFADPVELALVVDGAEAARARADRWRTDLEDVREGDGRVGFAFALPPALWDGRRHAIALRRADGTPLHDGAIMVTLDGDPPPVAARVAPPRPPADAPVELSIVVNFYDMPREAARTLTSLSRAFQRDLGDLAYEVLAIDNGSDPPLAEAEVTRHGPEFRLFRPSRIEPSPVFALNEAARAARGRFVAVMIDGAHLLSPGAIAAAMAVLRSERDPVVALRSWFVGGDQRWLSVAGYHGALQDIPFAKIGWPDCGYDIFRIASPAYPSPNFWSDGLSESNCLFLPTARFHALGGFDEGFAVAGGGYANLDLFARACRADGATLVALVGEATFHQYHGGTTTNVADIEKDARVRAYESAFEGLRGAPFAPVLADRIVNRGTIRSRDAFTARLWPDSRAAIGLTGAVRPAELAYSFDEGAQRYARVAYAEAGGPARTTWAGAPTGVAPADLIEIQQALFAARPEVVVLVDVAPGLARYVAAILPAIGVDARVAWITADEAGETPAGVARIVGMAGDPRVEAAVGAAERCCTIVAARDGGLDAVGGLLDAVAGLVSVHGYLIVTGGVFGQPDLGYSNRWVVPAIRRFLARRPHFAIDRAMNAHLVTTCPSGFLRRLPNVHIDLAYDPALDDLEGV